MAETAFLSITGSRPGARTRHAVPARMTWKDASGAVRIASVLVRHFDEAGVTVECETAVAIPLYRLVHLEIEAAATGRHVLPHRWCGGRVLSAVWQVGPCRSSTGTPAGYALRVLSAPETRGQSAPAGTLAVAS